MESQSLDLLVERKLLIMYAKIPQLLAELDHHSDFLLGKPFLVGRV